MNNEEDKSKMTEKEGLGCLLVFAIAIICFTIYKCVEMLSNSGCLS